MRDLPVAPGGVRAGQVSVLLLGRVIVGDIAITLTDLAVRGWIAVEPDSGDDWLITPGSPNPGEGLPLDHERRLLAGLPATPARLSALLPGFGKHMDKARSQIIAGAVHDGWIRRFRHDQRTSRGDELAAQVRAFQRNLRRALPELAQDILGGPLLPHAMRAGLVTDEGIPLVRFAHAAVRTLVTQPGWAPPQDEPRRYGEIPHSPMGYTDGAHTGGHYYG